MTNDQIIYNTAIAEGFKPLSAKFVVAQARFESNDYGSNVFLNNNNTSGMKYIGQPLASKGTLAPYNERSSSCKSGGTCVNGDYYAKFRSVGDSASDKISRLYSKSIRGVSPDQLKNAKTPEEFAALLKKRGYYGFYDYSTTEGQNEARVYANGIKAKLAKVVVSEAAAKKSSFPVFGVAMIAVGISVYLYFNFKSKN